MTIKHILILLFSSIILCFFSGCSNNTAQTNNKESNIIDCRGTAYFVPENARVVSCYGSFAEMWQLSGGKLVGITADAVSDHKLSKLEDAAIIGTVKEINLEKVVSLNPDYVILSEDITAHHQLDESLKAMDIPYGYFRVDSFSDYDKAMQQFCNVNQRMDLYEENVVNVKQNIDNILKSIPTNLNKSFLTMRCYSTGIKVKNDNLANDMLRSLKAVDICDKIPSLLKDFSLEQIISDDPDYIFVLTMGDEKAAYEYLETTMKQNPAWSQLSAVKNSNFIVLPKRLFHYKPNNRWDESYEYLAKILYPEYF